MAVTTTTSWVVQGQAGLDSLKLVQNAPVRQLGSHDVLVRFVAASLNYRDLVIIEGKYPLPTKDPIVPGSDGAGVVEEIGPMVTLFKKGDKVVTHFNQSHQGGPVTPRIVGTALGSAVDGVLRKHGVFPETGLVPMPDSLSFEEASALSCTGLTAWNALYGLGGKAVKAGDIVLAQGTGGVSSFIIQFALAAGAEVIATTSSEAKAEKVRALGVRHVINYKENDDWGTVAKNLTPNGEGVDHVMVVAGLGSVHQALHAVKMEGVVNMIGFVGDDYAQFTEGSLGNQPSFAEAWVKGCVLRNPLVGSRTQFEDMNRAIEANSIKPVVDPSYFKLDDVKAAYVYLREQKHFGKVVIHMSD